MGIPNSTTTFLLHNAASQGGLLNSTDRKRNTLLNAVFKCLELKGKWHKGTNTHKRKKEEYKLCQQNTHFKIYL